MNDLISIQEAIIELIFNEETKDIKCEDMRKVLNVLKKLPSAKERKKGKWIKHHEPYTWMGDTYWTCSECNFGEKEENKERSNFCPNCGCQMREGEEE